MTKRVLILGAGFGGLELASLLSEAMGDAIDVTLIDRADAFVFGFSKLAIMFEGADPEGVRLRYRDIVKPGVRVLRETVTAIEPAARRVTTDRGEYQADWLVIALGADYDVAATPGLAEHGYEFYSVPGAERVARMLRRFQGGRVIVGACGAPFKCPPAPSETVLLMHDWLGRHGLRERSEIALVLPMPAPVPPSPDTSAALLAAFAERGISFLPGHRVVEVATDRIVLDDGTRMPCDLFLGIPKHVAPRVVAEAGLTEDGGGWIPVTPRTLETRYPGVYAIGDVNSTGVPKAGVFAEGAARSVASALLAELRGEGAPEPWPGAGSCYLEFGAGTVGRVDVNFLGGPQPTGMFRGATAELRAEKAEFGASRRRRWFGTD